MPSTPLNIFLRLVSNDKKSTSAGHVTETVYKRHTFCSGSVVSWPDCLYHTTEPRVYTQTATADSHLRQHTQSVNLKNWHPKVNRAFRHSYSWTGSTLFRYFHCSASLPSASTHLEQHGYLRIFCQT